MRIKKIPQIYRNILDSSITISYGRPKCSLIWLHGLGDTSEGFSSFFTHLRSPVYQGIKIKIIQAPSRHITLNNGQATHSWYDIKSANRFVGNEKQIYNFQDIQQSSNIIDGHVKQEVKQWIKSQDNSQINPYHRVYIGGFSQGGVMSLLYSMQATIPPAGAICLSGHMLQSVSYKNLKKFPILLEHGNKDPIIKQAQALKSYQKLFNAEGLIYYKMIEGLQHAIVLEQLDDIKNWINQTFNLIEKVYKKQQGKKGQQ